MAWKLGETALGAEPLGGVREAGVTYVNLSDSLAISDAITVVPEGEPPIAATNPATTVGNKSALLHGDLVALGDAPAVAITFQYGKTIEYGSETSPFTRSAPGEVSKFIAGLDPSTTYHFRTKALGYGSGYGEDQQLVTAAAGAPPGDAPILVEVGGILLPNVEQNSIRIEEILGRTIGTAQLRLFDKDANFPMNENSDVVIYRKASGEKIFGGLASMPTGSTQARSRWWEVRCQQYTCLLETTIVFNSYPSGFTYDGLTGDQAIIAHLFEKSVVGFGGGVASASEIEARTYVGQALSSMAAVFFYYTTTLEAMTTIAQYSGWNFRVDHDKKLHYYLKENEAAPYALSSSPNGTTSIGYHNIKWKRDGSYVRNSYLMFGANLFSDPQEFILASNGTKTRLTLGLGDIGVNVALAAPAGYKTIRVFTNVGSDPSPSWHELEVGVSSIDTMPPKEVLHSPTGQYIDFDDPPPNLTNSVKVIGLIPFTGGQPDSDAASVAKYGRLFSKRLVANDANSIAALKKKLASYKSQFAYAVEIVTLSVDDTDFGALPNRFKLGQYVYLTNEVLGIVNKGYVIYRIITTIIGGQFCKYELELRSWFTEVIT